MRNIFKCMAVASVFFCIASHRAKAEDSIFSYPVANNYELTFTLKNAEKTAINNTVRYYRGGTPSLDVKVTASPGSGYY
jgi:hypothetical protein